MLVEVNFFTGLLDRENWVFVRTKWPLKKYICFQPVIPNILITDVHVQSVTSEKKEIEVAYNSAVNVC